MISQILGHHSRDVFKRYLPLDVSSQRICAIGFEEISCQGIGGVPMKYTFNSTFATNIEAYKTQIRCSLEMKKIRMLGDYIPLISFATKTIHLKKT